MRQALPKFAIAVLTTHLQEVIGLTKKIISICSLKTWILSCLAIFLQVMEQNHLAKLFITRTREHGNRVMYRYRQKKKSAWQPITWGETYASAEQIAKT